MKDKKRVNRDCQTISELLPLVPSFEKKSWRSVPNVEVYSAQKRTKIDQYNKRGIIYFHCGKSGHIKANFRVNLNVQPSESLTSTFIHPKNVLIHKNTFC